MMSVLVALLATLRGSMRSVPLCTSTSLRCAISCRGGNHPNSRGNEASLSRDDARMEGREVPEELCEPKRELTAVVRTLTVEVRAVGVVRIDQRHGGSHPVHLPHGCLHNRFLAAAIEAHALPGLVDEVDIRHRVGMTGIDETPFGAAKTSLAANHVKDELHQMPQTGIGLGFS